MGLTKEQQQAAYASGSIAVTAGAGTGKTHMLAERFLHFVQQGYSPLQIVAVTFTEKAASELKSRIRPLIADRYGDNPDLLAELEAAQISTFHALAARICREHPNLAQVPPDFSLQGDLEGPIWKAEEFNRALSQLPQSLFERIPYSLLREILLELLTDPWMAEQALARGMADWEPRIETARIQALGEFLDHDQLRSSQDILNSYHVPGDKLEEVRLSALEAIAMLQSGNEISAALETLQGLKINVGSAKKWGSKENLEEVKAAIRQVRDLVNKVLEVGIINLYLNEWDLKSEDMLPTIRESFRQIGDALQQAKNQQRVLDFSDLEIHALRALETPEVRQYYGSRWDVFLIDEFQDTNPIQAKILEQLKALKDAVNFTIVGDAKQSIYGFRRADIRIFDSWQQRLQDEGNPLVTLRQSFRTHQALLDPINQIFQPVLGKLHQSLESCRQDTPTPFPSIRLLTVDTTDESGRDESIKTNIEACRWVEAQTIADLIQKMLDDSIQVYDKTINQTREIQPGDIAVLARNWNPLEIYGTAIASRQIPILQAGGGSLLETREAKDGWSLLQFIADPSNNLALAAVLRSPFFAISDRVLFHFVQSLPKQTSWWSALRTSPPSDLQFAVDILQDLLIARRSEVPTRLLLMGDRLTGYTAVISNLMGCERRMADWTGFVELVRTLEQGHADVLAVVRRLQQLSNHEVKVPRPALEGKKAVSLMTIHGSKGLEWPVVIVPDLTHRWNTSYPTLRFDPERGLGLKLPDEQGERQKTALYTLLENRAKVAEEAETKRVLYVALTRARDHLILTAAGSKGGSLDLLQSGLKGVVVAEPIAFEADKATPVALEEKDDSLYKTRTTMVHPVGSTFSELPVTSLNDYHLCPRRFKFRYLEGHPGYRPGEALQPYAMDLGKLTHKSLELGIKKEESLAKYAPNLPPNIISEAQNLANRFRESEVYAPYRQEPISREQSVILAMASITFHGEVDLVGKDFVLDFKTDREIQPEHYLFQLWAYRKATGKNKALLAYLRHDKIHSFDSNMLDNFNQRAEEIAKQVVRGDFTPAPTLKNCRICPYGEICDHVMAG